MNQQSIQQSSVPANPIHPPAEVYLNGRIVPSDEAKISIEDRGFQFADGLYEVVRAYRGQTFMLDRHLERLRDGAEFLDLGLSKEGLSELERAVLLMLARSRLTDASIVVQVTRGVAPRAHLPPDGMTPSVIVYVRPAAGARPFSTGIDAITVDDDRWMHCDVKVTGLLPNVLAKIQAHRQGASEAIFIRAGHLTDAPACNVFVVVSGVVKTPPKTNYILHGVTREVVLSLSSDLGIGCSEQLIRLSQLRAADEVFMTGTSDEILPVISLDGARIGEGSVGPITKKLMTAFRMLTRGE